MLSKDRELPELPAKIKPHFDHKSTYNVQFSGDNLKDKKYRELSLQDNNFHQEPQPAKSNSRANMNLRTSYGDHFVKPEVPKNAWEMKKLSNKLENPQFSTKTTYNSEFVKIDNQHLQADKILSSVYDSGFGQRTKPKFMGVTTYSDGFGCSGKL